MATPTTLPASFTSGQVLTAAQMNNLRGAFRVLQVASTNKTDVFTTTSATMTDITGLSQAITPSATSNRVLVVVNLPLFDTSANVFARFQLVRGSTNIYLGDTVAGKTSVTSMVIGTGVGEANTFVFLDSPSTTSSTTYKLQVAMEGGFTFQLNRDRGDTVRAASSITVMEISA